MEMIFDEEMFLNKIYGDRILNIRLINWCKINEI